MPTDAPECFGVANEDEEKALTTRRVNMKLDAHQVAAAVLAMPAGIDWNRIDPLTIIKAQKAGILGPGLNFFLENQGWLKPEYEGHGTIQKDGRTGPAWLGGSLLCIEDAVAMLRSQEFKPESAREVSIRFYRAQSLGVQDWHVKDLCGDEGEKRLAHYGLALCAPDDAPRICKMPGLRRKHQAVRVIHRPLIIEGKPHVFYVEFPNDAAHLGGRIFGPHQQVWFNDLLAVRYVGLS